MTTEIEFDDKLAKELKADFNDVTEGISSGVQMILDTLDYEVEYVLSIRSKENNLMGLITNTGEGEALEIVMAAGENLHNSLNETKIVKPEIVLPH